MGLLGGGPVHLDQRTSQRTGEGAREGERGRGRAAPHQACRGWPLRYGAGSEWQRREPLLNVSLKCREHAKFASVSPCTLRLSAAFPPLEGRPLLISSSPSLPLSLHRCLRRIRTDLSINRCASTNAAILTTSFLARLFRRHCRWAAERCRRKITLRSILLS